MGVMESMRSSSDSTFMQIVMVLVVVSFIGWYATPQGESTSIIAKVNGEHIMDTEYRQVYSNAKASQENNLGRSLSNEEEQNLGEVVRQQLIKSIDDVSDVTVHIDPEDDQQVQPAFELPLRSEVAAALRAAWARAVTGVSVKNLTLHYLRGRIDVEVLLALDRFATIEEAQRTASKLADAAKRVPHVGRVAVHFE